MAVAANADDYANSRVNIFFPANNSTPDDGNLTGQCVTLVKWFMAEMANVPNPFAARGDARYVGDALVNQGLATVVPAGQQRRGDIVVWKYGTYGHIAVILSGGRIFQENANVAGATRRVLADGTVVYSSTIMAMFASLGGVAPSFYRLNSYNEGGDNVAIIQNADNWRSRCRRSFQTIRGRDMSEQEFQNYVGADFIHLVEDLEDNAEADANVNYANLGRQVTSEDWGKKIADLQTALTAAQANDTTDEATIADLQSQIQTLQDNIKNTPIVTAPTTPTDNGSSTPTEPPVNTSKLNELIAAITDWFKANFGGKK